MSGEDGQLFKATRKKGVDEAGNKIDLGLVGDIISVDPSSVIDLLESDRIPVISSVAPNISNAKEVLNVNADSAAGALAAALGAKKLVILTDVQGLYRNYPDPNSLITQIGTDELEGLIPDLASGMIPKMRACLDAVKHGVAGAHIIDGRVPHSLLTEIFTSEGIGTLVVPGSRLETDRDE
jgi:acetylglutamate kinase